MSDSEFLAFVRGDLSQRTKAELLRALEELHRRETLDWFARDMAEKRIQQTLSPKSGGPFGSSYNDSIAGTARSLDKEKAMKLITYGAILTAICAVIFLWGHSYTSNFVNYARAGVLNLAGQTDSAYRLASVSKFLGGMGFIGGLVMLIVGFARR